MLPAQLKPQYDKKTSFKESRGYIPVEVVFIGPILSVYI
jgi:hypothetical protein